MAKGGFRENSGRKKLSGSRHSYTVLDWVHEYIRKNGDGECVNRSIYLHRKLKLDSDINHEFYKKCCDESIPLTEYDVCVRLIDWLKEMENLSKSSLKDKKNL